jgi:hypothetical protein
VYFRIRSVFVWGDYKDGSRWELNWVKRKVDGNHARPSSIWFIPNILFRMRCTMERKHDQSQFFYIDFMEQRRVNSQRGNTAIAKFHTRKKDVSCTHDVTRLPSMHSPSSTSSPLSSMQCRSSLSQDGPRRAASSWREQRRHDHADETVHGPNERE